MQLIRESFGGACMVFKATIFFFLAIVSFGLASETHINAEPAHQTDANKVKWPDTQPVLRFAINHFPPYSILSEGKPPAGINVEAMKIVAEQLNMRLKFMECPFARCIVLLEKGLVDVFVGVTHSAEREEFLHFIEPPVAPGSVQTFYARAGSSISINEFADLDGLIVGLLRHSLYFPEFDKATNFAKVEANTHLQLIDLLLNKRIDAFVGSEQRFNYLLQEQGLSNKISQQTFHITEDRKVYLALSKHSVHSDLTESFSKALSYAKNKGVFETPFDRSSSE
ncbi:substrate-binding periplasmic protein [Alteromonas sp. RW2A1]|uniref:substrate-binding periplasmic protein n=1 Tax=Alteromonas sp. RW2A1 TaxID=1917158 RepID=UPI0009F96965|nr:transporter substrate-binding domain-containing protein [Alteromonas sp. RW2A1]